MHLTCNFKLDYHTVSNLKYMSKKYYFFIILTFTFFNINTVWSQSLPVGTAGIEDYYRRKQLLGDLDSSVSFSFRPIHPTAAFKINNIFKPDSISNSGTKFKFVDPVHFLGKLGVVKVLPLTWLQQVNSHHPYGWNDGAMIPSKGYQTMISGGFFAKLGPLSIQLRPEFVYAQNKYFEGFYTSNRSNAELTGYYGFYNLMDNPERFGTGTYSKANWGQSSIRLTFDPISVGLSNENLWWGPGVKNAIMMTNNASGFKHLTLNTTRPIRTGIGSFEAQIVAGKLENSGLTPLEQTNNISGQNLFNAYNNDWRYLSGFNISYQPKWVPGFFLGFMRDFMAYNDDIKGFKDYFPFFFPVQKATTGSQGDPFARDQRISMYARWLFPKAHAEIYFEYGINDNAYNYRDFIGSPDHARAYIFGITKLIPLKYKKEEFIQINAEVDQLSQSPDRLVRPAGGFYQHFQVRQGYTNLGQVLGAGTGSGGNLQSFDISWVKALNKLGIAFERYEHNADFYDAAITDLNGHSRRWVDFAISSQGQWAYQNFILNAKLQVIKSLNYQWDMKNYSTDLYYVPKNDVFNFHGEVGISFRF